MISHKHKFIFVHINKTGGTSLNRCLGKFCEEPQRGHPRIEEYIKEANEKHGADNYFKFSFVRNPWDKLLSTYFYRTQILSDEKAKSVSFRDWIVNSTKKEKISFLDCLAHRPQLDWIADKNENLKVDYVGRFENLEKDFNTICDKIGIPRQKLPHAKITKHQHYSEYYDKETRKIVADKFKKDIEYFGYEFGE